MLKRVQFVCLLTIFFLAHWVTAQSWTPPPPPEVTPIISEISENDLDGDRIDDDLTIPVIDPNIGIIDPNIGFVEPNDIFVVPGIEEELAVTDVPATGMADIELIFKEQITQKQIDEFLLWGGEISYVYQGLSYGWHGRFPLHIIDTLPQLMGPSLVLVEKAIQEKMYMDNATQIGRVRLIWQPELAENSLGLGFVGNSNITIGILDSGVDGQHTDLKGRQAYWMDQSGESITIPIDHDGHGTMVAGVAIGTGQAFEENNGTLWLTINQEKHYIPNYPAVGDGYNSFRGVAPDCRWAAVKVKDKYGNVKKGGVEGALDHLAITKRDKHNIKIINVSQGAVRNGINSKHLSSRNKINSAVENGVVMVVAAGNEADDGNDADGEHQPRRRMADPGRAGKAITVGASNYRNALTAYSTYGFSDPISSEGYKPDLIAPGGSKENDSYLVTIDSGTSDGDVADKKANDYTWATGTSLSAPFVAGCAALIIDAMEQNGLIFLPEHVKMLLCATATETNKPREDGRHDPTLQRAQPGPQGFPAGKDPYEGYGIVNPDAAIEAVILEMAVGTAKKSDLGDSYTDRRAWARSVWFYNNVAYRIELDNPSTGDFDLYVYSPVPDKNGCPKLLYYSTTSGKGKDEKLEIINNVIIDYGGPLDDINPDSLGPVYAIDERGLLLPDWSNGPAPRPRLSDECHPLATYCVEEEITEVAPPGTVAPSSTYKDYRRIVVVKRVSGYGTFSLRVRENKPAPPIELIDPIEEEPPFNDGDLVEEEIL